MDDDELMRELAEGGEERSLEGQVAELASTVADPSKRLAAKEWNWPDLRLRSRSATSSHTTSEVVPSRSAGKGGQPYKEGTRKD